MWDSFLEQSPLGHFQQSSRWARLKALDGWHAERIFLSAGRPDSGGLQLLWKPTRFGRIGYVSKGPVLPDENAPSVNAILEQLQATALSLGLSALILQPPDHSSITGEELGNHHFNRNAVPSIIRATALIDVSGGRESFLPRMNRQARREARLAGERGVTVRLGGRDDLPNFFQLMSLSCQRQGTMPNPGRVELLEALWDEFSPHVLLGLASIGGKPTAGLLMIGHGRRLTFWKKGWDSQDTHSFANSLLNVEALGWAFDRDYSTVDFAAIDPLIAQAFSAGQRLSEKQQRSRHMFNLRLGAQPSLLPPAQLLVINPVFRATYRLCSQYRPFENWLLHRLGAG